MKAPQKLLCLLLPLFMAMAVAVSTSACAGAKEGSRTSASTVAIRPVTPPPGALPATDLPAEARQTLLLIDRGGPFPHRKDGTIFQNREGRLPREPRGFYREYTVPTPGSTDRGARRIIAGKGGERYYTSDHYRTFVRVATR